MKQRTREIIAEYTAYILLTTMGTAFAVILVTVAATAIRAYSEGRI